MIKLNDYINLFTENEMAVIMQYVCGVDPSLIYGYESIRTNILFIKFDPKKKEYIIMASRVYKEKNDNNEEEEEIKKEYIFINNVGEKEKEKYNKEKLETTKVLSVHWWELNELLFIFEFNEKTDKVFISKEFFNETNPEPLAYPLVYVNKDKFREFELKIGLTNNVYSINDPCKSGRNPAYTYELMARKPIKA